MTLHEAIELILNESGRPMSSSEIANGINKRNLYSRQDKLPVPASQISARINNYPQIFSRESGKIKLVRDDAVSTTVNRFKNEISASLEVLNDPKIIIQILRKLETKSKEDNEDREIDMIQEPSNSYSGKEKLHFYDEKSISKEEKIKISYELINWYISQGLSYEVKISEKFTSFFSRLAWFNQGVHNISFWSDLSNHFLLKIAAENPHSKFIVEPLSGMTARYTILQEMNEYVENLLSEDNRKYNSVVSTGLFIPPFLNRIKNDEIKTKLIRELSFEKPKFNQALIVLPSGILSSTRNNDLSFKQQIIQSRHLASTIIFPSGMFENAHINVTALFFDFSKKYNEVFFLDATSIDTSRAAEIFNEKSNISNVSNAISLEDIMANGMDLNPAVYLWELQDLGLEPGYELYTIEKLKEGDVKRGIAIPRKKLYPNGEFKVIRTTEIVENSYYLDPSNVILGADHDEVRNIDKYLVTGGVVLSGFNKKLKANILPQDQSYVVGMDTYWINLDNEIILEDYFIREIQKEYVQKQVELYSKGLAIKRLSQNDLLKIKIKVPSKEMQKDFLLAEMKQKSEGTRNRNNTAELDFINTLKHSLSQPASSLGNDVLVFREFIQNKNISGEPLNLNESIVPVFDTDTPEQIAIHTVKNTLDRMHRMVTDIEYILKQASTLAEAKTKPNPEIIDLNSFFHNFTLEFVNINFIISAKGEITADRKQMRILFNNLITNAKKHGFGKDILSPTIWIEVKSEEQNQIQISIRNNGKPLPKEFTTEDFLAKGKSTVEDVGSGFGGFLIGQILKNHNGKIELIQEDYRLKDHNVEFLITLPN